MKDKSKATFLKYKDFVIIKDIGQGGTGKTKLLKDETLDENFVCKKYSTFYPEHQALYYSNFVNEIKILYKINHPNIVRVFNYYLYPELMTGYILMEYIDGTDIADYISSNPNEINNVFLQIVNGFKYLEKKNILHRDIRPNNILVSNDGVVKIIDFGFGKDINAFDNYGKSITLNWAYSLPDEFGSAIYDFKTELYFIGKLFELLILKNNLHNIFRYSNVLNRMIIADYNLRISSFYEIFRAITTQDSTYIKFTDSEKRIYSNIAFAFMAVCVSIENSTKYKDDIFEISKSLDSLFQKSQLEVFIQNNSNFIGCFISPPYRYKKNLVVTVQDLQLFIDWWRNMTDEYKIIVLNNLWQRFDTIKRVEANDLPF